MSRQEPWTSHHISSSCPLASTAEWSGPVRCCACSGFGSQLQHPKLRRPQFLVQFLPANLPNLFSGEICCLSYTFKPPLCCWRKHSLPGQFAVRTIWALTDSPEQKVSAPLTSQHMQKPKSSLSAVTESIIGVLHHYTPSRDDCCTPKRCSACSLRPSSPATWALRYCGLLGGAWELVWKTWMSNLNLLCLYLNLYS